MNTKSLFILVLIALASGKQLRFLEENAENGKPTQNELMNQIADGLGVLEVINNTGAAKMMGYVGLILDAAATIVSTFRTTVSKELVQRVKGEGFKHFVGNMEFDFTLGFRHAGYPLFMENMIEQFKVPQKYQQAFEDSLLTASFSEKDIFSDNSFLHDTAEYRNGNRVLSFFTIMIYHYRKDRKNKFDAIISKAEAEVKLFPNQLIYKTTKDIAGGIKHTEEFSTIYENRDWKADDIKNLLDFFQLETYAQLGKAMGITTDILV